MELRWARVIMIGACILLILTPVAPYLALVAIGGAIYGIQSSPDLRRRLKAWWQRFRRRFHRSAVSSNIEELSQIGIEGIEKAVQELWEPLAKSTRDALGNLVQKATRLHERQLDVLPKLLEEIHGLRVALGRLGRLESLEKNIASKYAREFHEKEEYTRYLEIQLAVLRQTITDLENKLIRELRENKANLAGAAGDIAAAARSSVEQEAAKIATACNGIMADFYHHVSRELERKSEEQCKILQALANDLASLVTASGGQEAGILAKLQDIESTITSHVSLLQEQQQALAAMHIKDSSTFQGYLDQVQDLDRGLQSLLQYAGDTSQVLKEIDQKVASLGEEMAGQWQKLTDGLQSNSGTLDITKGWELARQALAGIPNSRELIRELQTDGVMANVRRFLATGEALWSGLEIKARGLDYAPWVICYFKAVETYLNNKSVSRENPDRSKYTRTFGQLIYCIGGDPRRYLRHPSAWESLERELNNWRTQIRNSKTHKEPVHSRTEAAGIRTASLQLLVRLAREML